MKKYSKPQKEKRKKTIQHLADDTQKAKLRLTGDGEKLRNNTDGIINVLLEIRAKSLKYEKRNTRGSKVLEHQL